MTNLLVIAIAGFIWFVIGVIASTYVKAAVAGFRKKSQSLVSTIGDTLTYDLPDTSIYALTVSPDSAEYAAGEYLIRDNGSWRNVYLTQHARALMGESADVIALSVATVHDAAGTSRTWHVSIA